MCMDVSIEIENIKFNYRVAGIIKNKNNILLHKNDDDIFHAIPGGRIKIGETSKEALKREFIEEMGLTPKKLKFVWKTLDEIENIDLRPKNLKDILINNKEGCFDITEID